MTTLLRGVRRAGDAALLVELPGLHDVLALRAALEQDRPTGVEELVAAARTLLVIYDPEFTHHDELGRTVTERAASLPTQSGAAPPNSQYDTAAP